MKRAYVDSCIWITRFEGKAVYKHLIHAKLDALAEAEWEFCISEVVSLEVLVKPLRLGALEEAQKIRVFLQTMRQFKNYAGVFADALRIAQSENLKAMDAIHVALAQQHQCELFVSSDPHFRSLKTIRPYWIDLSDSAPPVGVIER